MVFSEYANYYDLYYAEKDYAAEVEFVLELASMHGVKPKTVLDMGCGTGRHLAEFHKRGLKCDGFDLSSEMHSHARKRLTGTGINLSQGNLIDFENGERYDILVALFAVMGYLTDNTQLAAGLETARKHLEPDGIFVFDGWFGPAVLFQQPEKRRHEYTNGQDTIVREVTPHLDPVDQTVTVHYDVYAKRDGQLVKQIQEDHIMRFMFVQEMKLAMERSGLELAYFCPFPEPNRKLTTNTWNVTFVGRRKGASNAKKRIGLMENYAAQRSKFT